MSRPSPVGLTGTPGRGSGVAFFVTRIVLSLLWIQNSGWKTPPDFGREAGGGLYKFTRFAIEHEVLAPYAFVVRELILPNFTLFGWLVLVVEASLGAFLLLGLATRLWALIGVAQSLAITLSVLNAPGEWSWAYYLMIASHLAIFAAAAGRHWGLDGVLRPSWERSNSQIARLLLRGS